MTHSGLPNEHEHAAADWAIRIDRGLSIEEQTGLEAWVGADGRRYGALVRAMAVLSAIDPEGLVNEAPVSVSARSIPSRRFRSVYALIAALAGFGAFIAGPAAHR